MHRRGRVRSTARGVSAALQRRVFACATELSRARSTLFPRNMRSDPPATLGRHTVTLYLGPVEDEGPEASESSGEAIWFDRRDPQSIRRAQEILRDRLRLSVAPTLCDEPSPGLGAALGRIIAALFGMGLGAARAAAREGR
ncbi:hypothetical protein predicted by Glimmer/Critica [Sorangium cellulosum So ce56]|uniref:Uncharacterized protein n=1 Tax=Sorangium cellulosum (strain So ce56) TaxID=448385 RepID=A9F4B5_SORC5|nr:hypothetical protein predicted by Glimmer/Critica [Sorangium cellulosum So ce56]